MKRVLIIAEAGVNHNGSLNLAKQLIDVAATAGVDYVKFQSFISSNLVSRHAEKASYQKTATGNKESQLEMIKKLELSADDHQELLNYCKEKRIAFLSTPFDFDSIELLKSLGVALGKIPSGEITNYPYLVRMARAFNEIILSTGMSDLVEVEEAIKVLLENGRKNSDITILHCNTEYPTPMGDVNLRAMQTLREKFKMNVGYSDHTLGIEVPIAAVALGATVIEKHFTLDRSLPGPDHKASLEPAELLEMVKGIRNVELALGSSDKVVTASEQKNKAVARKSIVARSNIKTGDVFTEDNLCVKRPGTGLSPMQWNQVIGKTARRDFNEDDLIEL